MKKNNEVMKKMNEVMKNGKEVKKVMKYSNKRVLGVLLEMELKKDVRFVGMSFDEMIEKIESLRKERDSHLSDRAYALFLAYKNGLNVFKKYEKHFDDSITAYYNEFEEMIERKKSHYSDLIWEFHNIRKLVAGLANMFAA